jgi:hypothetical protein
MTSEPATAAWTSTPPRPRPPLRPWRGRPEGTGGPTTPRGDPIPDLADVHAEPGPHDLRRNPRRSLGMLSRGSGSSPREKLGLADFRVSSWASRTRTPPNRQRPFRCSPRSGALHVRPDPGQRGWFRRDRSPGWCLLGGDRSVRSKTCRRSGGRAVTHEVGRTVKDILPFGPAGAVDLQGVLDAYQAGPDHRRRRAARMADDGLRLRTVQIGGVELKNSAVRGAD